MKSYSGLANRSFELQPRLWVENSARCAKFLPRHSLPTDLAAAHAMILARSAPPAWQPRR
jgi:hypothetical protein